MRWFLASVLLCLIVSSTKADDIVTTATSIVKKITDPETWAQAAHTIQDAWEMGKTLVQSLQQLQDPQAALIGNLPSLGSLDLGSGGSFTDGAAGLVKGLGSKVWDTVANIPLFAGLQGSDLPESPPASTGPPTIAPTAAVPPALAPLVVAPVQAAPPVIANTVNSVAGAVTKTVSQLPIVNSLIPTGPLNL